MQQLDQFEFSADSDNENTKEDNDKFDSIVKMQSVLLRGKENATANLNAEVINKKLRKHLKQVISGPVKTIGEVSIETSMPSQYQQSSNKRRSRLDFAKLLMQTTKYYSLSRRARRMKERNKNLSFNLQKTGTRKKINSLSPPTSQSRSR